MPHHVNEKAWAEMATGIVNEHCIPRAQKVADACNEQSAEADHPGHYLGEPTTDEEKRGYRVGTEGNPDKTAKNFDFRATVITATYPAMADNARNNRLVSNFHLAEGEE